jgi:uncharacterized protein YbjT (DUF2867 family)
MNNKKICLLGGAGFVGRHITHQLDAQGYNVRVVTSRRDHAKELFVLPAVDIVEANIHNENALVQVVSGCDAVINLVGVLHDSRKPGQGFHNAHVELTRKVIAACKTSGVARLLHMSALQADVKAPSAYLRSKGEAEQLVRKSGLHYTIFRPSVIFGRGDNFLNTFAGLIAIAPVIPLAGAKAKFQPIWVEDVARAFTESLSLPDTIGKTYNLCGTKVYTLRELVKLVAAMQNKRRIVLNLPGPIAYAQALAMECLPGKLKLLTRDNLRSMQVDNICNDGFPTELGFMPSPLEIIAPEYLSDAIPRGRYPDYRAHAGRARR